MLKHFSETLNPNLFTNSLWDGHDSISIINFKLVAKHTSPVYNTKTGFMKYEDKSVFW